jgi:hypothetical protein
MPKLSLVLTLGMVLIPIAGEAAGPESGPPVGAKVEGFKVFVATGDLPDRQADLVSERKGLPTVFVFVPQMHWSRPVARLVKALDTRLEQGIKGAEDATAVAVWLTDDAEGARRYLPRAQHSLLLAKTPLCVFEDSKQGPASWAISDAAAATVVVVRGGKVVKTFAGLSADDLSLAEIVSALETAK